MNEYNLCAARWHTWESRTRFTHQNVLCVYKYQKKPTECVATPQHATPHTDAGREHVVFDDDFVIGLTILLSHCHHFDYDVCGLFMHLFVIILFALYLMFGLFKRLIGSYFCHVSFNISLVCSSNFTRKHEISVQASSILCQMHLYSVRSVVTIYVNSMTQ